jgi:hypothetical protein
MQEYQQNEREQGATRLRRRVALHLDQTKSEKKENAVQGSIEKERQ